MVDFLKSSRTAFNALMAKTTGATGLPQLKAPLWFVLGNEAHDLDSQCCTLALSFLLSRKYPTHQVFPLMNIPREEAKLRKDNLHVLKKIGIVPKTLIYLDDLPLKEVVEMTTHGGQHLARICLCDHNELSPRQGFLKPFVRVVIDHHVDSNQWSDVDTTKDGEFDVIVDTKARSCSSLVANKILTDDPELLNDRVMRLLLKAPILMDSGGLTSAFEIDKTMYRALIELDAGKNLTSEVQRLSDFKLLATLGQLRGDLEGLTPIEIVQKDLKYATDNRNRHLFAVSSVKAKIRTLGLKEKASRIDFMRKMVELLQEPQPNCKQGALSGYFILLFKKGPYKRLLAAVRKDILADGLLSRIERWLKKRRVYVDREIVGRRESAALYVTSELPTELQSKFDFCIFELDKPVSRKQVLPLLVDALGDDATTDEETEQTI